MGAKRAKGGALLFGKVEYVPVATVLFMNKW
jgi:hypothetical protein